VPEIGEDKENLLEEPPPPADQNPQFYLQLNLVAPKGDADKSCNQMMSSGFIRNTANSVAKEMDKLQGVDDLDVQALSCKKKVG
jgi:hypothetical protein